MKMDTQVNPLLRHIRRLGRDRLEESASDADLLAQFAARRQSEVFEVLLERHGEMVLGVCQRVLNHVQDAEDVFQATFLVLARKAGAIRKRASLGSWLYGVAYRLSLKLRASAARRHTHQQRFIEAYQRETATGDEWTELRPILDEELGRLPEKYRIPLVLCYLEGKTNVEAARELGWPSGSISKRLNQGRELLRRRLTERGIALSAATLITFLTEQTRAAVPAAALDACVRAAPLAAAGQAVACAVSTQAAALAEGALKAMFATKLKTVLLVLILSMATIAAAGLAGNSNPEAKPDGEAGLAQAQPAAPALPDLDLVPTEAMAMVRISWNQLWESEPGKKLRGKLGQEEKATLQDIEKKLGLPLADVDTFTLIFFMPDRENRGPELVVLIKSLKPYSKTAVRNALAEEGTEEQHQGKKFFAPKDGSGSAIHFVDDRLFAVGDAASVKRYLEGKAASKPQGPLSPILATARGRPDVWVGFRMPEELARQAKTAPVPEALAFLKPLLDLESGSLAVELGPDMKAQLSLYLPNATTAKEAARSLQDGIDLLRQLLAGGAANALPRELRDDEFMKSLVAQADTVLGAATVRQDDKSVRVRVSGKSDGLFASAVPALFEVRKASRRMQGSNNLKQLGLAMHGYHDTHQRFPPAALSNSDGKPLLSWRVAILPYIEQAELYKEFHLDEPWDSPHNKKLIDKMPKVYAHPQADPKEPHSTYYRVFTGTGTVFEDAQGQRIADITDGTSNTIMIVEAAQAVPWTKPDDLPYDAEKPLPKLGHGPEKGFSATFCDGSVRFILRSVEEKMLRALITRNGGEVINDQ